MLLTKSVSINFYIKKKKHDNYNNMFICLKFK